MILQLVSHEILNVLNGFRVDFTRNPDIENIVSVCVYVFYIERTTKTKER